MNIRRRQILPKRMRKATVVTIASSLILIVSELYGIIKFFIDMGPCMLGVNKYDGCVFLPSSLLIPEFIMLVAVIVLVPSLTCMVIFHSKIKTSGQIGARDKEIFRWALSLAITTIVLPLATFLIVKLIQII